MIISTILKGSFPAELLLDDCAWLSLQLQLHLQTDDCGSSSSENLVPLVGSDDPKAPADSSDQLLSELECLSKPIAVSSNQAIGEFLDYVYEQADNLLSRCLTQPNSRSNTPIAGAKHTPPVFGGLKSLSNQSKNETRKEQGEIKNLDQQKRGPRRVQLFSSNTSDSAQRPKNKRLPGNSQSDFKPLGSSTPHSQRAEITLADYVTQDRRKTKKTSRKSLLAPNNQSEGTKSSCKDTTELESTGLSASQSQLASKSLQKPSRRITPTSVSDKLPWSNFKQQAVFTPQSPQKTKTPGCVTAPGNFDEERQRLREKKAQLMTPILDSESAFSTQIISANTPTKSSKSSLVMELIEEPNPAKVTCENEVKRAAEIFSILLSAGKTQDITADLLLMIQLLCCQIPGESSLAISDRRMGYCLLCTAHDGVMFAVEVLSQCQVLQNLFDSSVCRLLSENERLVCFSPSFAQRLISNRQVDITKQHSFIQSSFDSVSFQADTDNSKNFPCDRNFLIFKKQRDLFYEIKREWDSSNTIPGWSFTLSCSEKIFQLLNQEGADISNYVHLSRLFLNQLIVSCLGETEGPWSDADDDSISLLTQLKQTQPEKYRKLRERFVVPTSFSGQTSRQNKFTGQEIFFKAFIDVAKDAIFIQHLKDTFTLKLLEMNDLDIDTPSVNDPEMNDVLDTFSDCVLTSRLVAKFLGHINFLPYSCSSKQNAMINEQYRQLREAASPPLDVMKFIQDGRRYGRLCIVIPWLVQYISQADPTSLTLLYYKNIIEELISILDNIKKQIGVTVTYSTTLLFQYVNLTWLLKLSKFDDLDLDLSVRENPCAVSGQLQSLDSSPVASLKIVYSCSDTLQCIKNNLVEFVMGHKSKVTASRKITPITADIDCQLSSDSKSLLTNDIQQMLEDNFFHNQPSSLKKSVGFLAERISSSYIKEFRSNQLIQTVQEGKLHISTLLKQYEDTTNIKERITPTIHRHSVALIETLREKLLTGVEPYFEQRSEQAFTLLLPSETENYIITICRSVALRQGIQRIKKWLSTNLTVQYMKLELLHVVTKTLRTPSICNETSAKLVGDFLDLGFPHRFEAPSPSSALLNLQLITGNFLVNPHHHSMPDVHLAIANTLDCIQGRCDIIHIAMKSMLLLLVTLIVALVTNLPGEVTPDFIKLCSPLWELEQLSVYTNELVHIIPDKEGSSNFNERLLSFLLVQTGCINQ